MSICKKCKQRGRPSKKRAALSFASASTVKKRLSQNLVLSLVNKIFRPYLHLYVTQLLKVKAPVMIHVIVKLDYLTMQKEKIQTLNQVYSR